MKEKTENFKWKYAGVSALALLGGAAIFGIPDSAWWDTGSTLARVLFYGGIASWIYTLYFVVKNID